eukprot:5677288-Prymnesium_polylepis.1
MMSDAAFVANRCSDEKYILPRTQKRSCHVARLSRFSTSLLSGAVRTGDVAPARAFQRCVCVCHATPATSPALLARLSH